MVRSVEEAREKDNFDTEDFEEIEDTEEDLPFSDNLPFSEEFTRSLFGDDWEDVERQLFDDIPVEGASAEDEGEFTYGSDVVDGEIVLNPIYKFRETGTDENGRIEGVLERTENPFHNVEKLRFAGIFDDI